MVTIQDADSQELIEQLAKELKNIPEIQPPEWANFVKTGMHKQRPPVEKDWWYMRSAAVLRKIDIKGPLGVSKLRRKYGGKKNRGHRPEHFYKGSGSIIRNVMQQLEKAGLVIQKERGVHKGRITTPKAKSIMTKIAVKLLSGKPKPVKKAEAREEKSFSEPQKRKVSEAPVQKKEATRAPKKAENPHKKEEKEAPAPKKEEPKEEKAPKKE